jgi:hypothetical protein
MPAPPNPFRWFDSSPEVIRLVVLMYVRCPLSLRNVEDLLFEHGIDICHETVRKWWNRFGLMFASEIRRKRVQRMRQLTHWKWHLDEGVPRTHQQQYLGLRPRRHPSFGRRLRRGGIYVRRPVRPSSS